jgi:hypothetical protein
MHFLRGLDNQYHKEPCDWHHYHWLTALANAEVVNVLTAGSIIQVLISTLRIICWHIDKYFSLLKQLYEWPATEKLA